MVPMVAMLAANLRPLSACFQISRAKSIAVVSIGYVRGKRENQGGDTERFLVSF